MYVTNRNFFFFMIVTQREREAQAEGEAGSMHREPDVGLDPGSPGSRPGAKGRRQTAAPPRDPPSVIFSEFLSVGTFETEFFSLELPEKGETMLLT